MNNMEPKIDKEPILTDEQEPKEPKQIKAKLPKSVPKISAKTLRASNVYLTKLSPHQNKSII
jgi:hypothetical protein